MIVEFHPEAESELIEAAAYYDARIPGLGDQLGDEVAAATSLLEAHPELGQRIDPELRRLPVKRFPFSLIYSATPDVLRIVAVAHQRRRPGYWRGRVAR